MPSQQGFRQPGPLALVALGGTAGALVRATLAAAHPTPPGDIPWPTFVINVTGALLLGALLGATERDAPPARRVQLLRWCLGTGVLGGFTTYSTFMLESLVLLQRDRPAAAATYVVLSVLIGALAGGLGWYVAAHGRRPPVQAGTDPE